MIHVPNVQQSPAMCGPASLRAALLAIGIDRTEEELARLAFSTRKHGTTAEGMLFAARAAGALASHHAGATWEDLRAWVSRDLIPIVDWWDRTDGHWSVVVQVGPKRIALMDPDRAARRWLSRDVFERNWFDYQTPMPPHTPALEWRTAVVVGRA